jgi:hypothetical protein
MALPGMRSTADWVADQRPKNFRQGILLMSPRNDASLFALTAAMSSESTDDPEFYWWEESVQMLAFTFTADLTNVATTVALASGALMLKSGDVLRFNDTGEAIRVVTVVSDTSITVTRAFGANGTAAGTAAAHTVATDPKLLFIGSAYREGAPRSTGTSYNPTKKSNVTQIFRDPVEWTRTATKTRTRTGDEKANDRRRILHKHSMAIERSFWMGTRFETMESGQPLRMTDGIMSFVPASNIKTVSTLAAGGVDMEELESYMAGIFAYGSSEKLAYGSIATMIVLAQIVRKNSHYQWGPNEKEYGMNVKRLFTPAGTLVLTEHPLFGQAGQFLANDLFVLDTAQLKYRYITDTTLLKDRQDKGTDGEAEEYLTEAGLEVHHGETFYWLKGITKAKVDD